MQAATVSCSRQMKGSGKGFRPIARRQTVSWPMWRAAWEVRMWRTAWPRVGKASR